MKTSDIHERVHADDDLAGPSNRKFGVSLGAILVAIAVFGLYFGRTWAWWVLALGVALLLLGLMWPVVLDPLNRGWMALGVVLFHVVNPVVMALIYVLTIVPMGLVMRWLGKDPLRLRRDHQATTYWIKRVPPGPAPKSMKNQF